ncbi:hypothetical protein [Trichormus variabilis]|uniref:Uncharacterized protein n=1 Tax=Trichormus variabilis SAG 1403-4b TaxID=447716 RepID=A0A3S1C063_ANAVA|nr:hypothetical protein [Trichormus variabilis]RUS92979.1 hypothetical protein DSM107003_47260 [Trichormus variabilis SAG 1403-4b]
MNKYRLLEIAEYISIFAALAGSTIAVTTGQIIYTTVPMALSLLLNLVRRSQFEEQLRQRINGSHAERYQQILDDIQSLKTAVLEIYFPNNNEAIQDSIIGLSEKIDLLRPDHSQLTNENFSELETQYQNLQETLNGLIYRMLSCGVLSSGNTNQAEKGIANIVSQYQKYKQEYKKSYGAMLPEDLEDNDLEDAY